MSGGDPVCVIENDRASLSSRAPRDSYRSLAVGGSVMRNNPLFVVHTYTGGGGGRRGSGKKEGGSHREGRVRRKK